MVKNNNPTLDDTVELDSQTLTQTEHQMPAMYAIVMHNDDYTTMEFVVWVLIDILKLGLDEAYLLMMKVHTEGSAAVIVLPKEQAELKAHQIRLLAEQEEYPLLVTIEPA